MILQTDKTSLEIQTALLAGKQILLKYNNQIIGKIIGEQIRFFSNEVGYGIFYLVVPKINFLSFFNYNLYLSDNNPHSTLAEAKASTDPVYLYVNEQSNDPITDDPIINDPGSSR